MYCLHYSKAQPRENQLQELVAIALSMTQSFARQTRRCLVEDKKTCAVLYKLISWTFPGGKE